MYLFESQPFKIISFHFSACKADFGFAPEIGKLPMQQFRMRESPRTLLDADKFKILLWLVKCYLIHVISECAPCSKSKFPSREKKKLLRTRPGSCSWLQSRKKIVRATCLFCLINRAPVGILSFFAKSLRTFSCDITKTEYRHKLEWSVDGPRNR